MQRPSTLNLNSSTKRSASPSETAQSYIKKRKMRPTLTLQDIIPGLIEGNAHCQGLGEKLKASEKKLAKVQKELAETGKEMNRTETELRKAKQDGDKKQANY